MKTDALPITDERDRDLKESHLRCFHVTSQRDSALERVAALEVAHEQIALLYENYTENLTMEQMASRLYDARCIARNALAPLEIIS